MTLRDKEYEDCDHGIRDTHVPSSLGICIYRLVVRKLRVEEEF